MPKPLSVWITTNCDILEDMGMPDHLTARTGASQGFPRAAAPVGVFSRGTTRISVSCFFNDPADVGNLISGFSAFPKSSLNIWKFTVHILLKPGLENFEYLLVCEMSAIVR